MTMVENIKFELDGRLRPFGLGKYHLSVRYEPDARIVRVGACLDRYDLDTRETVIDALLDFEESHGGEFSLEFDVIPLESVNDVEFAEA